MGIKVCIFLGLFLLNLANAEARKRVVVADNMLPIPSLFLFLTDAKLVYIPQSTQTALKNSIVGDFFPQVASIKSGENDSFEELLALNADLYVCYKDTMKLCSALQKANVKTLPLKIKIANYNSKEVLKYWLNEINKHFDIKEKSDKIIADIDKVEKQNAQILKGIKPISAMIMSIYQNKIIVGAFGDYLLQNSGGVDIFKGVWNLNNGGVVNIEEIYRLNPEVIYLTNFTPAQPEDLINNKKWQGIDAIKNKRVYKLPLATYRPYAPNLDLAVLLKFLAQKNHPKLFKNIDIKTEYKRHFKEFYDLKLTNEQIKHILNPSKEAGMIK